MKAPKYFVETMQQAIDLHLNAFAMQLMAESFSDVVEMFGDENVVFLSHDHKGRAVWFVMTKTMPTAKDFDPVPREEKNSDLPEDRWPPQSSIALSDDDMDKASGPGSDAPHST